MTGPLWLRGLIAGAYIGVRIIFGGFGLALAWRMLRQLSEGRFSYAVFFGRVHYSGDQVTHYSLIGMVAGVMAFGPLIVLLIAFGWNPLGLSGRGKWIITGTICTCAGWFALRMLR